MASKSQLILPYNSQAVLKAAALNGARTEYRIEGVKGLVLLCQPSGSAKFIYRYVTKVGTKRKFRKVQIGDRKAISLAAARDRAIELFQKSEAGADPFKQAKDRREAITFNAMAERFLSENTALAATTRAHYEACFKRDVYPVIGDVPAAEVTTDHVVEVCLAIEKRGAATLADHAKTAIGGCYRWGRRARLVSNNPCQGIGRRNQNKVARTRTPTDAEIAALWAAVTSSKGKLSHAMSLIVRLAMLTGQRRAEVAGARVSELEGLDTDAPFWVIPGDVNKRGKVTKGRSKNRREQRLPLSRQAAELFQEALEKCADGECLFPADQSKVKIGKIARTPHIHPDSVTMAMSRLRVEAGIEDVSVHDFRRAASNWMKDQGISREVRDLVLNHLDPSVTEAHYSQNARMSKQVLAALQAWADHVWQVTGQATEAQSNVVPMLARV